MTNQRKRDMSWQTREWKSRKMNVDRNNKKSKRFKIIKKMISIFEREKRRLKKRKKLKKKRNATKKSIWFFVFFLQFFSFLQSFFFFRIMRSLIRFIFALYDRNCMCWNSSFRISCQFILHSISIVFMKSSIVFSSNVISLASRSRNSLTKLISIAYKSINFCIVVKTICLSLTFKKENVNKINHIDTMSFNTAENKEHKQSRFAYKKNDHEISRIQSSKIIKFILFWTKSDQTHIFFIRFSFSIKFE